MVGIKTKRRTAVKILKTNKQVAHYWIFPERNLPNQHVNGLLLSCLKYALKVSVLNNLEFIAIYV